MTTRTAKRLWLAGSIAAAIAVPPLILRPGPAGYADQRRRVADMNEVERAAFDRNASEYLKLAPPERAELRTLHESLESDRRDAQGKSAQASDDYYAWLSTIPRSARDELRRTTDPAQRIEQIQTILEQQAQAGDDPRPDWMRGRGGFGDFSLSKAEFAEFMAALESVLPLSEEQRLELEEQTAPARYFRLFGMLRDKSWRLETLIEPAKAATLLESLPERVRAAIDRAPTFDDRQNDRRRFLMAVIFASLRREYDSVLGASPPTEEELREYLAAWPTDKQAELDELLELEPGDFRDRVNRRYLADVRGLDWEGFWSQMPREPPGGRFGNRPGDGDRRGREDSQRGSQTNP